MGNAFSCPERDVSQSDETSKGVEPLAGKEGYWNDVVTYWSGQWLPALADALECYQFAIYGNMEPYISQTFFQGSNTVSWVVYGVPFVMRAFGGLVFGTIADHYGRRPAILATFVMMCGATIGQGLTPTVDYLGPTWLIICRITQAIAFGGEVGSLPVYLAEQSHSHILTMSGMVATVAFQLGIASSSLVALILASLFEDDQMLRWGWRVPFLLVAIPGAYTLWAAQSMPESSAFEEMQQSQELQSWSLGLQAEMAKEHWVQLTLATSGIAVSYVVTYLAGTYLQEWLMTYCGVSPVPAFWIIFAGQALSIPLALPFAYFGDACGLLKLNALNSSFALVTAVPMYAALYMYPNSMVVTVIFGIIFPGAAQAASVGVYPFAANLFPTKVRGTGSSIACNIACLMGGVAPAICASTGIPLFVGYYTAFFSAVSLVASVVAISMHSQYKENGEGPQISHLQEIC